MQTAIAIGGAASGRSRDFEPVASFAVEAEKLGVDAVWSAEAWGQDAVTPLAFLAARTSRLRLGTGVTLVANLDPVRMAEDYATVDCLSGGRVGLVAGRGILAETYEAFGQALDEHAAEGGVSARGARYAANCRVLVEGMRELGFETFLAGALQAPIIVTFRAPSDPRFDFARFYDALAMRGYLIYPGKLTQAASFRIGCIGRIDAAVMQGVVAAVAEVTGEMGFDPAAGSSSA